MPFIGERALPGRTERRGREDEAASRRSPDVVNVLQLQRATGNQAVARMLRERRIQRALSDDFKQGELAKLAWPNVPTAGAVLAIATRAAKTHAVKGAARRLVNEIGDA